MTENYKSIAYNILEKYDSQRRGFLASENIS